MSDSCNIDKLKCVQNNALQESWLLNEGRKMQEFQMLDSPDSLDRFFSGMPMLWLKSNVAGKA